jgi:hypothetical protein
LTDLAGVIRAGSLSGFDTAPQVAEFGESSMSTSVGLEYDMNPFGPTPEGIAAENLSIARLGAAYFVSYGPRTGLPDGILDADERAMDLNVKQNAAAQVNMFTSGEYFLTESVTNGDIVPWQNVAGWSSVAWALAPPPYGAIAGFISSIATIIANSMSNQVLPGNADSGIYRVRMRITSAGITPESRLDALTLTGEWEPIGMDEPSTALTVGDEWLQYVLLVSSVSLKHEGGVLNTEGSASASALFRVSNANDFDFMTVTTQ